MSRKTEGHSIAVVSRLTGIPIETLRVWERRYGFPSPARRAGTNRRAYRDTDIERLRWAARAIAQGFRAGDVVPKKVSEIEAMLAGLAPARAAATPSLASVDQLVQLLARDDVAAFETELRRLAGAVGPKRFVTDVAQPLAVAVGVAWSLGTVEVRQEHFASECLITQLRTMLGAYQDLQGAPVVVLATLPGEPHALGLVMVALYLAISGAKPRLIGPNTPPEQIVAAARALHASVVGLTLTSVSDTDEARVHLRTLTASLPRSVSLWLGGSAAPLMAKGHASARVVSDWSSLDHALLAARDR